jgi:hypothetical protein
LIFSKGNFLLSTRKLHHDHGAIKIMLICEFFREEFMQFDELNAPNTSSESAQGAKVEEAEGNADEEEEELKEGDEEEDDEEEEILDTDEEDEVGEEAEEEEENEDEMELEKEEEMEEGDENDVIEDEESLLEGRQRKKKKVKGRRQQQQRVRQFLEIYNIINLLYTIYSFLHPYPLHNHRVLMIIDTKEYCNAINCKYLD